MRVIGHVGALATLLLLASFAAARADDTPLAKANVGDWVEFKGTTGGAAAFGGGQTHTIRYTVKAKSDKSATLTVKSWAGELEMPEQEIELPLDEPFDAARLAPGSSDKVSIKLEKTIPNLKYKIKAKEFQGTAYQYKMGIDLFSGLLPGGGGDAGKPLETSLAYFVTPEAPVLGIALFTMKGLVSVKYELSDGTDVGPLLYPTPPPKPAKGQGYKVGDWLEFRGINEVVKIPGGSEYDNRQFTLRYTAKAIEAEQTTVSAEFKLDDEAVETWEFTVPVKDQVGISPSEKLAAYVPRKTFTDFEKHVATDVQRGSDLSYGVLEDRLVKGTDETLILTIKEGVNRSKAFVTFGKTPEVPLTGFAKIELSNNRGMRVKMLLAEQSGVEIETEAKPKPRTSSKSRTKSSSNVKTKRKPN